MNALQMFLLENPVNDLTAEVVVSERLKDWKFKVCAMTGTQYQDYQKRCIKNPTSAKKREFDTKKFNELIVINHTVEPSFKDGEFMRSAEAPDSATLLYKCLAAGEIANLANEILNLSGFDNEFDGAQEEAKN